MNRGVGRAQIGQWYVRWHKGETFRVTGYDHELGTIAIQTLDGDLGEIDEEAWEGLTLGLAGPPEDWSEATDELAAADLSKADRETSGPDWNETLESSPPTEDSLPEMLAEEDHAGVVALESD